MTPARKLLLSCCVLVAMGALLTAASQERAASGRAMVQAARQYLDSLSAAQRQQTSFRYDDEERLNWHFIPRERKGLPLKDLEGEAMQAAHALIQSGLSQAGYEQALNVMSLEEVLYLLEGGDRQARRQRRDPLNYYISIFGTPGERGTWGWRLEGHHLSLNYSIEDGQVVATTPEFFGANPAFIEAGPERSIRVLGPEEDIARQILKLATGEQQRAIWIDKKAPDDVRGGGVPQPEVTEPAGLPAAKMSDDQKQLLRDLIAEYLKNMPPDVAQKRRAALDRAGIDKIHFAWWGGGERNDRHAYRVQGPTFIVEYNNTQNNANHVHSMWRDVDGDFNVSRK